MILEKHQTWKKVTINNINDHKVTVCAIQIFFIPKHTVALWDFIGKGTKIYFNKNVRQQFNPTTYRVRIVLNFCYDNTWKNSLQEIDSWTQI